MSFTMAQVIASARSRIGNKSDVSVGEHMVSSGAIESEIREAIAECCRTFGASSACKEQEFWTCAGPRLSTPLNPTAMPSETGGLLGPGTYSYKVTATIGRGETLASGPGIAVIVGATGSVAVTWAVVPNATGYKVYGRQAGPSGQGEQLLQTVQGGGTVSWTDTGAITPASGLPAADTTGNGFLQDYDCSVFIGSDVMMIEEVLRSDAYRSDAFSETSQINPLNGMPAVRGTFIDMTYQQSALEHIQAQERFRHNDEYSWEQVNLGGSVVLRLMPPPIERVLVSVRYLSTSESIGSLPDRARATVEYAACGGILDCIINRLNSEPPGVNESPRDKRSIIDALERQRDRYWARYRSSIAKNPGRSAR